MLKTALAVTFLCAPIAVHAEDPRLPVNYTCEQVRAYVAQYGKLTALLWAKLNGASSGQIAAARRCLR